MKSKFSVFLNKVSLKLSHVMSSLAAFAQQWQSWISCSRDWIACKARSIHLALYRKKCWPWFRLMVTVARWTRFYTGSFSADDAKALGKLKFSSSSFIPSFSVSSFVRSSLFHQISIEFLLFARHYFGCKDKAVSDAERDPADGGYSLRGENTQMQTRVTSGGEG